VTRATQSIALQPGERWWGGLVANGAQMPFSANSTEQNLSGNHNGNQAAPFLTSNRGRYLWSDQPFSFHLTADTLEVKPSGDLHLETGGDTLRGSFLTAAKRHFPASGAMPDPLMFTHPQYNTWIELLYNQNQTGILEYAQAILDHGFPSGVLMIDDNWQCNYGDWNFHTGRFRDPRAMVDELHVLGFKVMLWVCPFITPDSLTFRTLESRGVLLKTASGETAIRRWWNGYSAVLDFSNPAAVAWFDAQLDHLTDAYGVDGFKFDAGDPIWYREDDAYHNHSSPTDQCERYARLGLRFTFNEFRASWRMGGQGLAQRQRDKAHAWSNEHAMHGGSTGLASLIPDAIAQGLLGYPFTCPDMIGGGDYLALDFSDGSSSFDPELFVRSAQIAALMPMMQFSAAPWRLLDAVNLERCRRAAHLHVSYGERILELARHAALTGEPIVRSLEYVFPHQGFEAVNDQFMLGDDLLVAPILNKSAIGQTIILPAGNWRNHRNDVFENVHTIYLEVDLDDIPVFQKLDTL
jgi:alpha-glucosidase (family GH31 glycosyl hydrolase)